MYLEWRPEEWNGTRQNKGQACSCMEGGEGEEERERNVWNEPALVSPPYHALAGWNGFILVSDLFYNYHEQND